MNESLGKGRTEKVLKDVKRIFLWLEKNQIELKQLTDKVVAEVTKHFEVDKIILFGSYAKNNASD